MPDTSEAASKRLKKALQSIEEMIYFPDDEDVGQLRATLIGVKAVATAALTYVDDETPRA